MAIRKFEDILSYSKDTNYAAYHFLVSKLREQERGEEKMVCYIGTGLSFYYKSWAEPFEKIMNRYLKEKRNCVFEKFHELETEMRRLFDEKLYIELAEELDRNIKAENEKKEENEKTIKNVDSFNWRFNRLLLDRKMRIEYEYGQNAIIGGVIDEETLNLPIASIYYIPYYAHHIITTNCDDSLRIAYELRGEEEPHKIKGTRIDRGDVADCKENREGNNRKKSLACYIHGYWNEIESLIMTKSAYEKFYGQEETTMQQEALRELVERNNTVFLGVGFEKDEVLNYLQPSFEASRTLCFYKSENEEDLKKKREELEYKGMRVMMLPDFVSYIVVLEQAIREVKNRYWNQDKIEKEANSRVQEGDSLWYRAFSEWVDDEAEFAYTEIDLFSDEGLEKVSGFWELIKNLRVPEWDVWKNDRIGNWRCCHILDEEFSLEMKGFSNLSSYNLPLGNTIYYTLKSEIKNNLKIEEIKEKLEDWTKSNKWRFENGIKVRFIIIDDYDKQTEYFDNLLREENIKQESREKIEKKIVNLTDSAERLKFLIGFMRRIRETIKRDKRNDNYNKYKNSKNDIIKTRGEDT